MIWSCDFKKSSLSFRGWPHRVAEQHSSVWRYFTYPTIKVLMYCNVWRCEEIQTDRQIGWVMREKQSDLKIFNCRSCSTNNRETGSSNFLAPSMKFNSLRGKNTFGLDSMKPILTMQEKTSRKSCYAILILFATLT